MWIPHGKCECYFFGLQCQKSHSSHCQLSCWLSDSGFHSAQPIPISPSCFHVLTWILLHAHGPNYWRWYAWSEHTPSWNIKQKLQGELFFLLLFPNQDIVSSVETHAPPSSMLWLGPLLPFSLHSGRSKLNASSTVLHLKHIPMFYENSGNFSQDQQNLSLRCFCDYHSSSLVFVHQSSMLS